jgi:LysM repeat protein
MNPLKTLLLVVFTLVALVLSNAPLARAQVRNDAQRIAALEQEIAELRNQNNRLREEMEDLRALVTRSVRPTAPAGGDTAAQAQIRELARTTDAQIRAAEGRSKRYTDEKVATLAKDVNRALTTAPVAPPAPPRTRGAGTAGAGTGKPARPVAGVPETGITYTIKSGDTIGKIAVNHRSRIAWIHAANNLSEKQSRSLKIGARIFVPQRAAGTAPVTTPAPADAAAEPAAAEPVE